MTSFSEKVYRLTKKVPRNRVTTYKEIARAMGTKAYRAVGQALKRNPYAPQVPCHRVVSTQGTIGGFGGQTTGKAIQKKKALLKKEGIQFTGNRVKNFKKLRFLFPRAMQQNQTSC